MLSAVGLALTKSVKMELLLIPLGIHFSKTKVPIQLHGSAPTHQNNLLQLKHIQDNLSCIPLSALTLVGMALC